jgi:hypothetical protein
MSATLLDLTLQHMCKHPFSMFKACKVMQHLQQLHADDTQLQPGVVLL